MNFGKAALEFHSKVGFCSHIKRICQTFKCKESIGNTRHALLIFHAGLVDEICEGRGVIMIARWTSVSRCLNQNLPFNCVL